MPQMRLDMLHQDLAEDVGPGVILGDADLAGSGPGERGAVALAAGNGRKQVDSRKLLEGAGHRYELRLGEGIGGPAAEGERADTGRLGRAGDEDDAIGHDGVIGGVCPVPFEHGEFGQMQVAALAVPEHPGELEKPGLSGRQQLLAGEFRRSPQISAHTAAVGSHDLGPGGMQMGFVARRDLENGGFDLDEALLGEKSP